MTARRLVDIIVAILFLKLLLPLYVIIALAVRLTSKGPVIFRQQRVGHLQKPFVIYKFRTLQNGSGRNGFDVVTKGDVRLTPVGQFLRSSGFDELPQLWNIFRGDMTLVGPRPQSVGTYTYLSSIIRGYDRRTRVLPGLTGLAKVRGSFLRTLKTLKQQFALDMLYIRRQSFYLDLVIIFQTLPLLIRRLSDGMATPEGTDAAISLSQKL